MAFQDIGIRLIIMGSGEFRRGLNDARSQVRGLSSDLKHLSGTTSATADTLTNLGSLSMRTGQLLSTHLTVPVVLLGGALVAAGIQFEDAFAGVAKTVEGVSDDFGNLTDDGIRIRDEFRKMALEIPIAATEFARIGELAGQLGISADEIEGFTRTVALLGVTTEMTSEDAATFFARFGNIMGVAAKDMAEFTAQAGSTVVDLGNKFAATEPEIAALTLRLAGAGQAAGLTAPKILAIATAMASLGIQSEMGGSAISRVLLETKRAVDDFTASGGEASAQLELFANAANMTVQEFVRLQNNNPTEAFLRLIGGINRLQEAGMLSSDMLKTMNLDTIRLQDVMNRLGPNIDFVRGALKESNDEWGRGTALQLEAQKRFNTTKSQLQLLRNAFSELGITIFYLYKNDIDRLIKGLGKLILGFSQMEDGVLKTIIKFTLLAAAIGPVLIVFGSLLSLIGLALNGFKLLQGLKLASVFAPLLSGQAVAGAAGGIAGIFTAITSAIGVLVSALTALVPVLVVVAAGYMAFKANLFGIADLFNTVSYWAKTLWSNFINLTNVTDDLSAAWDDLKAGNLFRAFDHLVDAFNDVVFYFTVGAPTIDKAMTDIQNSVVTVMGNIAEKIKGIDTVREVILAIAGAAGSLLILSKAFSTLLVVARISAAFSPTLALFKAFLPLLAPLAPVLLLLGAAFIAVKTNLAGIGDLFNVVAFWVKTLVADLINLTMFDEFLKKAFNLLLSGDLGGAWENIKLALDELLRFLQTGGPLFEQALTAIWDAFMVVIGNIVSWITANASVIGNQLLEWANAFLTWIIPIIEPLLQALGALAAKLIAWVIGEVPAIKAQLIEWATAFIAWVEQAVPKLVDKLGDVIQSVTQWIKEKTPEVIKQLEDWGKAFVDWISTAPGKLIPKLGDLLSKMLDWAGKAVVMIVQKLYLWGAAFLDWLGPVVRDIMPKLGYFLGRIIGWIASAVILLIPELAKLAYQFIVWVANAAIEIAPELGKFLQAILDFFLYTMIPGIITGALGLGKGIIDGLKQGIGDNWESLLGWIEDKFRSIPLIGDKIFEILSPSHVMAEMGKNLVLGLQQGMMNEFGSIDQTVKDMSNRLLIGAEATLNADTLSGAFARGSTTYNNSSNVNRTNIFSPTINGAQMGREGAVSDEIARQYRMAVLGGA